MGTNTFFVGSTWSYISYKLDTNQTWNFVGTAAIEFEAYETIVNRSNSSSDITSNLPPPGTISTGPALSIPSQRTELDVLTDLGWNDEDLYDCYIHHYYDYYWTELDEITQQAFEELGWNSSSWEGSIPAPPSEDKLYAELDSDEQQAAAELCYLPETWDGIGLEFWTTATDYYETLAMQALFFSEGTTTAAIAVAKTNAEEDSFGTNGKEIDAEEAESSAFSAALFLPISGVILTVAYMMDWLDGCHHQTQYSTMQSGLKNKPSCRMRVSRGTISSILLSVVVATASIRQCQANGWIDIDGRHSFSLSTFDPSGKLGQVEYAAEAAALGTPVVAISLPQQQGVFLAAPQVLPSPLIHDDGTPRFARVTSDLLVAHSGLSADGRVLVEAAQQVAVQHEYAYDELIPVDIFLEEMSLLFQEYTMKAGSRPFGVTLIVAHLPPTSRAGAATPMLYRIEPSGVVSSLGRYAVVNGNKLQTDDTLLRQLNELTKQLKVTSVKPKVLLLMRSSNFMNRSHKAW